MSFKKEIKVKSNFSRISIGLASPEEILDRSSGEVLKPETVNYRTYKPERDGLFCERIFGPSKDYECHCGKYKRIRYRGIICDRCGVEVTEKKVRRERMGHIELTVPVAHIWYFRSTPNKIGYLLGIPSKKLDAIIYYERYVVIQPGAAAESGVKELDLLTEEEYLNIIDNLPRENQMLDDNDPNKFIAGMGAESIYKLLCKLDLDDLSYSLRSKLETETSQQRKAEALKRLSVIEAFREAKDAGLVTALVAWPACGGCPDVDHLVSKIYATGPEEEINSASVRDIYSRHRRLLEGFHTIELDDFAENCTLDIIREFSPDLLLTYFAEIDSERHKKGVDTALHVQSLERVGRRISHIYQAVKDAGALDETTFFLTADHGQIDTRYTFNINQALMDKGYIKADAEGNIISWRIFAQSAAFTAQIYTRDISHTEAKRVLEEIGAEHPGSVDRILNRFECRSIYHTDGDFTFMIEGLEGVSYGRNVNVPLVMEAGSGDYKTAMATHGHAPERGPKPPFVIAGRAARDAAVIEEARLVDEAPTILRSLGIGMERADGRVLDELLEAL